MADSSLPITGASYTTSSWSKLVDPDNTCTGVYGFVGNAYAALSSTQAASRAVYRALGVAYIQGFRWEDTSPMTLLLSANGTAYSRIDRVVLRLDPSSGAITTQVIVGTAAASPAPPAITAYDLSLAQIVVRAGAATVASGDITDERYWLPTPSVAVPTQARLLSEPPGSMAYIADVDRLALRTASGVWRGVVTPTRYGAGSRYPGTYTGATEFNVCALSIAAQPGDRYVNVRAHLAANPAPDNCQYSPKLYINGGIVQRGVSAGPWLTMDLGWDGVLSGGNTLDIIIACQRIATFTSGSLTVIDDSSYTQIYATATPIF